MITTKKNAANFRNNNISELSFESIRQIANAFSEIAGRNNFTVNTCAEEIDLSEFGIEHGKCIDDTLIEKLTGCKLIIPKDKNQRDECGCVESIDIGLYNTCLHECKYCYANYSQNTVLSNYEKYDIDSPLLCSSIREEDKITDRKVKSLIDSQLGFGDI